MRFTESKNKRPMPPQHAVPLDLRCTWVDCGHKATKPQLSKSGGQWANLCDGHDRLFTEAVSAGDAKAILSRWIKAQGGAKAASARM